MTRRTDRNGRGFTLLELLVAIAAMGVVTSIGVRAFFGLTDAWRETRRIAELEVAAQSAFDAMRDSFGSVVSSELSGEFIQGQSRTTADPRFFQVVLGDDRISLPVFMAANDGELEAYRVEYSVDRAELGSSLVRVETPLSGEAAEATRIPVLNLGDILRLQFEYADPTTDEWSQGWSRPEMPAAVRVSLTVAYRERIPVPGPPKLQISRKAVFPVQVR
jgi:prepilin-type N-terminal cleavage/methylation domain-containing protein